MRLKESPGFGRAFSWVHILILVDWVELFCHLDVVLFVWLRWFWGLTCDFAGVYEVEIYK